MRPLAIAATALRMLSSLVSFAANVSYDELTGVADVDFELYGQMHEREKQYGSEEHDGG
jgi:hypothetical protein